MKKKIRLRTKNHLTGKKAGHSNAAEEPPSKTDKIILSISKIPIPTSSKRLRIQKLRQEIEKAEKNAKRGRFDPAIVSEYIKACIILEPYNKPMEHLFTTLISAWKRQAGFGKINREGIQNYQMVASEHNIEIDDQSIAYIQRLFSLALLKNQRQEESMMTDEEYIEFLKASANEFIRIQDLINENLSKEIIEYSTAKLISATKLTHIVKNDLKNEKLCKTLATELQSSKEHYENIARASEISGINDAISQADYLMIREFRFSALNEEEINHIRLSGTEDPEKYTNYLIAKAKNDLNATYDPEEIFAKGRNKIESMATQLKSFEEKSAKGSSFFRTFRKHLNGIAKLLSGAATAGMDIAPIFLTTGAAAYIALPSFIHALLDIKEGIGRFADKSLSK